MSTRGNRRAISDELEVNAWKFPDGGALLDKKDNVYRSRKRAIELYLTGATDAADGPVFNSTYRLIRERCLAVHKDGEVWGWRGLIHGFGSIPISENTKLILINLVWVRLASLIRFLVDTRSYDKNLMLEYYQHRRTTDFPL